MNPIAGTADLRNALENASDLGWVEIHEAPVAFVPTWAGTPDYPECDPESKALRVWEGQDG